MAQRLAVYHATWNGADGIRHQFPIKAAHTRGELVAWVDSIIRECNASERLRRGVNLRLVWRVIQSRGSGAHASFTLDSCWPRGTLRFNCLSTT